ncbi:hypothetical protein MNBD_NITROSPINAE03-1030 [hydrothermal vent metagenome]|uniref:PilZ domain-containing protein n=1 Tax=hydrothermal vent metagenome TaxID=652676 RepID=A0A3B1C2I6_9ZZZZ
MTQQDSGVEIPVGDVCQIQLYDEKMFSTFRGSKKPDYALIDVPTAGGKPAYISPNAVFLIRFLEKGSVYGFKTSVIKTYSKPSSVCVIEYPASIKTVNLRKSRRITTLLPATIETENGSFAGAFIDLSEGGGLFSTLAMEHEAIKTGAECFVSVTLPSGEKVEKLRSHLCSVKKREGKTLVGLCFDHNGESPSLTLQSYYDTCSTSLF